MKNQSQIPVLIAVLLALTLTALPGCKDRNDLYVPDTLPVEIASIKPEELLDSIVGKKWHPFAEFIYASDDRVLKMDTIRNCCAYSEMVFSKDSLDFYDPLNNNRCRAAVMFPNNFNCFTLSKQKVVYKFYGGVLSLKKLPLYFDIRQKEDGYIEIYIIKYYSDSTNIQTFAKIGYKLKRK